MAYDLRDLRDTAGSLAVVFGFVAAVAVIVAAAARYGTLGLAGAAAGIALVWSLISYLADRRWYNGG